MPLYSKSIQEPAKQSDGIRICIMRKPKETTKWDIWMPSLAPSLWLLNAYLKGTIDWNGYIKYFTQEVLVNNASHIKLLEHMAQHTTITILCWKPTPEYCHRRLILEAIKKNNSSISVVIR